MSHTGVGAWQSWLPLQRLPWHVPIEPSLVVQYSPVAQLFVPPTTRQPAVHVPVLTVEVSQYEPAAQSLSMLQPQTPDVVVHAGVGASVARTESSMDEHCAHCPASREPLGWHAGKAAVGHELGPGLEVA